MDGKFAARKLVGSDEDRAVSPVIGVILMVAITVILAAVIAAFVLDMGQNQSTNANAGVNIDESSSQVDVTWSSEGNSDSVTISATVIDDSSATDPVSPAYDPGQSLSSIGETTSVTVEESATNNGNEVDIRVTITATTSDGDETVISNEEYTVETVTP